MPTWPEKAALAAQVMPPLLQPDRRFCRFSKLKPFGLIMYVKYKPTKEFSEGAQETMGFKCQAWAEGESKHSMLLL